jgi:hypothetical protein
MGSGGVTGNGGAAGTGAGGTGAAGTGGGGTGGGVTGFGGTGTGGGGAGAGATIEILMGAGVVAGDSRCVIAGSNTASAAASSSRPTPQAMAKRPLSWVAPDQEFFEATMMQPKPMKL